MTTPWTADVLTLYPQAFEGGALNVGILQRAQAQGRWRLNTHAWRNFGLPPHQTVDDTPSGGGAGMVLRADIAYNAVQSLVQNNCFGQRALVYPSPRGQRFTAAMAQQWAQLQGVIMMCGRFEGIDERIFSLLPIHEVCVGDAVLCGGEAAAALMIEATVRLLPQVTGNPHSIVDESFSQQRLEYPHYTRPALVQQLPIPLVLQGGHHARITHERAKAAESITQRRRPDLLG